MKHHSRTLSLIFALLWVMLNMGCSWDSMQRTGYETVESMRLQQCLDKPDADCPASRTRYEDYQSERERVKQDNP